jgi:hypothetical protein
LTHYANDLIDHNHLIVVYLSLLGFRIERTVDGIPIGKLVIRLDGRWVDVVSPPASGSTAR